MLYIALYYIVHIVRHVEARVWAISKPEQNPNAQKEQFSRSNPDRPKIFRPNSQAWSIVLFNFDTSDSTSIPQFDNLISRSTDFV